MMNSWIWHVNHFMHNFICKEKSGKEWPRFTKTAKPYEYWPLDPGFGLNIQLTCHSTLIICCNHTQTTQFIMTNSLDSTKTLLWLRQLSSTNIMQSAKSMRLETPAAQNLQPEIQFVHQARAVLVHQGRQLGHATSFASMFGRFEINSSRGADESWWMFMVFIIKYGFIWFCSKKKEEHWTLEFRFTKLTYTIMQPKKMRASGWTITGRESATDSTNIFHFLFFFTFNVN